MEDLEYLPSFEAARYFGEESLTTMEEIMKGRFLTRNIVLFRECTECDVVDEMDINELLDYGVEEECHNCGSRMVIGQEFVIKD